VAVQSHYFGVGSLVSWAEAGVGAVATQSVAEPAYGPRGLELMRAGKSAPEVLHELLSADSEEKVRQVAMVDRAGRVAVHSGPGCIDHAGHAVGNQVSAQANIMKEGTVPRAMLRAYDSARGDLADRLLAALDGAEAEGGDLRGRQSAALIVVAARARGRPSEDTLLDLRVDDHDDPLGELRRLLGLQRAYARADAGDQLAAAGDLPGALREYAAAHAAQPDNPELAFWHGAALAANGSEQEATPILREVFAARPGFAELLERLPAAGLFPDDGQLIARLIGTRAESAPAAPPAEQRRS
jgi:uncharacterized Ntn-hydrolase superfamily protein